MTIQMEKMVTQMDYLMKMSSELKIKLNQISNRNDAM